jgi:hypothetical protein
MQPGKRFSVFPSPVSRPSLCRRIDPKHGIDASAFYGQSMLPCPRPTSRVRLRHLDTGRHGTQFQVRRCVKLLRGSLELPYNDLALARTVEAWTKTMMLRRGLASLAFAQMTDDRVGIRLCKAPGVRERALGLSWAVSRMADL